MMYWYICLTRSWSWKKRQSSQKNIRISPCLLYTSGLTAETSFKEDLGADSLDLFEMVMALEEEFEVEIPTEDLENIKTIGDVESYLQNRL